MKIPLTRVIPGHHYTWTDVGEAVWDVLRGVDPRYPRAWVIIERETGETLGVAPTLPLVRETLREHLESLEHD